MTSLSLCNLAVPAWAAGFASSAKDCNRKEVRAPALLGISR
jgi:hypothetical protein